MSRQNPNLIFVTQKVGSSGKLWKSEDGGSTWSDINLPFTSNETMYLSINIEHELFLALRNGWDNNNKVFKSTDLGNSWTNLSTDIFDGERIVNIQVQEGTDGGVYVSANTFQDTVEWTSLNNGYYTSQLYAATVSRNANSNVLHGGFQDNGNFITFSDNPIKHWYLSLIHI